MVLGGSLHAIRNKYHRPAMAAIHPLLDLQVLYPPSHLQMHTETQSTVSW